MKVARDDGTLVKCIGMRCHSSKNVFGHVIPCKGVGEDKFVANLVIQAVSWLGHVKLILKSDDEKALTALVNKALAMIKTNVENVKTVTAEHSPAYDSQGNGGTEVGVKILRGQFRMLKLCLESRLGFVSYRSSTRSRR